MSKTILAVAVGSRPDAGAITTPNAPNDVRPYIQGLIDWLRDNNRTNPDSDPDAPLPTYNIGADYQIVYRERGINNLPSAFASIDSADLILCMSTSVAKVAANLTTTKPIVAIVSDPFGEGLGSTNNVCGVSALRDRLASACLKMFRRKRRRLRNGKVYVLHREGYPPSDRSKLWLGSRRVEVKPVGDTRQSLETAIHEIVVDGDAENENKGVLVLPADRFFGSAADIVQLTGSIVTFWSTPDFPTGSFGGYGFPQNLCGRYLAERVATIWHNQDTLPPGSDLYPSPKWVAIDPKLVDVRP